MPSKMKAVWKNERAPGFKLGEAPVPKPGPLDVLIKVKATSICGTDLHIFEWDPWAQGRVKTVPYIFGHEMAGEIVELGSAVLGLKIGDHVSAETHISCGHCFQCKTGNEHICENVKILGVDTNGCFAEYVSIPARNAWVNPKEVPHWICTAQEPLGNAVHTVFEENESVSGQTVAIFGAGPIGLCAAALCRASGAEKVFIVDINDVRLKKAKEMGAHEAINSKTTDPVKFIKDATNGRGTDVFIEMSGNPICFKQGIDAMRVGGRASLLGVYSKPFMVDMSNDVVFKGARVHGINGRRMFGTWYKSAAFLRSGAVDLSKIVTHRLKLEEIGQGFEAMKNGTGIKVVLSPES